ncbi:LysR substrate-binding domain-containing protein [Bosea thiooxidans]
MAETLHFSRASVLLGIAQPALSQQIKMLEIELGVVLFNRDRRNVRLSEAGTIFLAEARLLLAQFERTKNVVERIRRAEIGRIAIGYAGSIAYSGILERSVRLLRGEAPEVEIVTHELDLGGQLARLAAGTIDIALTRLPIGKPATGLDVVAMCEEEVLVAMPVGHRLEARHELAIASLEAENFVSTDLGEGLGFFFTQSEICRISGFEPRIMARSKHFATLLSLVASGEGIALVPCSTRNLAFPGIIFRPIDVDHRSTIAAILRSEPGSPVVQRYIRICARVGEELDRG